MKSAIVAVAGFFGLPYYYSDIKLYYSADCMILENLRRTSDLWSGFYSTPWMNLGFLQSLYGSSPTHFKADADSVSHIEYIREIHTFEDGGSYSLDWTKEKKKKILFIVPGLTGGSEAVYIKHIVDEGVKRGFQVVVMNGRGINGTPLTTRVTKPLGCSREIECAINVVTKLQPGSEIVAVGTSMGANQLLKYAGEQGEDSKILGFCALSTPFDVVICSRFLRKQLPHNSIPDNYLVMNMLQIIKNNEEYLLGSFEELGIDLSEVYNSKRSFEFDSLYSCKMLGFKNPEHYYRENSCVRHLHNIRKPTLAISALDDPVVTPDCVPHEEFKANPYIALAETKRGGHLGWFSGYKPKRVKSI